MSEAVAKLKPLLDALTADERAELSEYIGSLGNDENASTPGEWEEAWIEECDRRVADLDSGKTVGIPADEFMKRMKEKYG